MILKDDLRAGKITRLSLQVDFKIIISNLHVCTYRADFTYHDRNGNFVVEDTKGKITDVYRIKRNLMLSVFGIKILET